jgi:soluble lytic murein transglycosylase-like protein
VVVAGTGAAILALPIVGATTASAATTSSTTVAGYPNTLDGWIRESLAIMAQKGIPGTYNGIYRNVIRESSGNPYAINNWDSNAAAGTPSKGLLQVIDPTFRAYHVAGTSFDPYDPVANITAACNYAAAVYGSIDNVYGAY